LNPGGSVDPGGIFLCGSGVRQLAALLKNPFPATRHPGFYRSFRNSQLPGNLLVGELLGEDQPDQGPFPLRQIPENLLEKVLGDPEGVPFPVLSTAGLSCLAHPRVLEATGPPAEIDGGVPGDPVNVGAQAGATVEMARSEVAENSDPDLLPEILPFRMERSEPPRQHHVDPAVESLHGGGNPFQDAGNDPEVLTSGIRDAAFQFMGWPAHGALSTRWSLRLESCLHAPSECAYASIFPSAAAGNRPGLDSSLLFWIYSAPFMRRKRQSETPEHPGDGAVDKAGEPVNRPERVFGVVLPVPAPLSRLADRVRRFYDPNFPFIGPHVTVLPPRALALSRREVLEAVRRVAGRTAPLRLSLGKVSTFRPVRPVVYVGFRRGTGDLRSLHRKLSRAPLRAEEAFPYVPHLTLGQNLDERRLRKALDRSMRIFTDAGVARIWHVESLIVVERRSERRWILLEPLSLAGAPPRGKTAPPGPALRP